MKHVSTQWHKRNIKHLFQLIPGDIEIKKDNIYKKEYASKCFVIRVVELKANEIDLKL